MVNLYVEQAIGHLELGMKMRNADDAEILVKTITSVRKDLIELQKWIRERNECEHGNYYSKHLVRMSI